VWVGRDARFEWRSVSLFLNPVHFPWCSLPNIPRVWQTAVWCPESGGHGDTSAEDGSLRRTQVAAERTAGPPSATTMLCCFASQSGSTTDLVCSLACPDRGFRTWTTALAGTDEAVGLRGRGDMVADRGGLILRVLEGRQDRYEVPCVVPS
jgi:hypothetical protein